MILEESLTSWFVATRRKQTRLLQPDWTLSSFKASMSKMLVFNRLVEVLING